MIPVERFIEMARNPMYSGAVVNLIDELDDEDVRDLCLAVCERFNNGDDDAEEAVRLLSAEVEDRGILE